MNDNHSASELNYRPRWQADLLRRSIKDHPVVVLTGARQTGKSTLLSHEPPFEKWLHKNLDDLDLMEQAEEEPSSLWSAAKNIVIDEVQRVPSLLHTIKRRVDENRKGVRFILSGSSNLLLMRSVSESLAGRAVYYTLFPMMLGEIEKRPPSDLICDLFQGKLPEEGKISVSHRSPFPWMLRGCMPTLMEMKSWSAVLKWWEGYVMTYLERDLRQLSQIESLPDFRRVMRALALRSGQLLNQTGISREIGVSQPTIHRYIKLLETTFLFQRLPAFSLNRTKRLVKSPKVMWVDPGLVSFLCGYNEKESLASSRQAGGIFEVLVYLHLRGWAQLQIPQPRIYYWRTVTGHEVDFIIEWGRRLLAVEVKLTSSPKFKDTENLRLFLNEYPETTGALLLHTGKHMEQFHEKILAIPWYWIT